MTATEDASWRSLYRMGGIAFLVAGTWYLILTVLLLVVIARSEYLDSSQALMNQIIVTPVLPRLNAFMAVIVDMSQVTGFVVLMLALRQVDRSWPVLAVVLIAFVMLFDMQDGLIEWAMTYSYAAYPTASEVVQSAYEVQAELIYQYIDKVATPFMALMVGLSVGITSSVLRNSEFSRSTTYLGFVVAGVCIVGGLTTVFPLLLSVSIWYLAVGVQLFRRPRAIAYRQGAA